SSLFFIPTASPEPSPLSLHDALPISSGRVSVDAIDDVLGNAGTHRILASDFSRAFFIAVRQYSVVDSGIAYTAVLVDCADLVQPGLRLPFFCHRFDPTYL